MTFTLLDVIIIAVLAFFGAMGFFLGLIQGIGALIGLVLGLKLAGLYYLKVADFLTPILLGNAGWAKVVAFILIFTIANRLIGLLFYFINKIFKLIAIIPFLGTINRFGGLVLGLIEGIIILSFSLAAIGAFEGAIPAVAVFISGSKLASWLSIVISQFNNYWPNIVPEAFKTIKTLL